MFTFLFLLPYLESFLMLCCVVSGSKAVAIDRTTRGITEWGVKAKAKLNVRCINIAYF
jgi:hypothetical protein